MDSVLHVYLYDDLYSVPQGIVHPDHIQELSLLLIAVDLIKIIFYILCIFLFLQTCFVRFMVARKILNEVTLVMFCPKILGFLCNFGFFKVEGWKSSLLNESIIMTSCESFALLMVDMGGLLFCSFLLFFPCFLDFFLRTEIYLC